MKRIVMAAAVAAGLVALAAPPANAIAHKPDALIKESGGSFLGNNIYNIDGTDQRVCAIGNGLEFTVKIQNDGTKTKRFRLGAEISQSESSTITVTFKGNDVTDAVFADDQRTNRLSPGERSKGFKITATMSDSGQSGFLLIGADSPFQPDAVRAQRANSGICAF